MEEYETLQAKLKSLLKKEKSAIVRFEENNEYYEVAKQTFEKENEDVEKLQSESLSTYLKRLIGKHEKELAKEMQEQLNAKIELDVSSALFLEAKKDLTAIHSAIDDVTNQLEQLKDRLFQEDEHFREKITTEEIQRAELKQELIEVEEASVAGERVLQAIDSTLVDLDSANSFSTWDLLAGSFLIDMMKYNKIDKAEEKMRGLELLLENYTKELKDLSLNHYFDYETFGGMNRTFDIFFDNIFSDWSTKEKIGRNIQQLTTLSDSVVELQRKLELNKYELEDKIEESELLF
ncbi:hypothetical protein LZ578_03260 [Jeotgalibaca sp. MA1X17-3]|uniref:hypothetical protein n=1 Tax=Jeotgalibaca sp. MA1X17-3 TaxID=2908211 RepID=UPI001F3B47F1|nr:hypothetical protein [Jeotgalibaca sp. MA1X17-3]UJF16166.1 hypothetical protein LZ578_03260 [Jeotgalibaca sp. MA1X17-3]